MLTVTPTAASSGDTLTVTGSGWDANATVEVMWGATITAQGGSTEPILDGIGQVQADGSGNVDATLPAIVPSIAMNPASFACPSSVTGEQVYGVESSVSNPTPPQSAPESIAITPWLALANGNGTPVGYGTNASGASQYAIAAGSSVTLGGCFFAPDATYSVSWPGGLSVSGGTVGSDGSFSTTVSVPSDATTGSGTVTVGDGTHSASIPVLTDDASIALGATSAAPDGSFTVAGTGFSPGTSVSLLATPVFPTTGLLNGAPNSATVAADGSFQTTWTVPADQAAGTYAVQAVAFDGEQAGGGAADEITVQPSNGSADTLSFTTQPTDTTEGSAFSVAVALLSPTTGQTDTAASDTISLSLVPTGGETGNLGGTTSVQAQSGVATFNNLSVTGGYGSGYALRATDTSDGMVVGVASTAFAVAKATDTIAFSSLPTDVVVGTPFQVTVSLDTDGTLDTSAADTLTLTSDAPNGQTTSLTGQTSITASGGVATFHVAFASGSGPGFGLTVSDATNPAVSAVTTSSLAIVDPSQDTLSFTAQPPSNVTAGQDFNVTVSAINPATDAVDTANSDQVDLSLVSPASVPPGYAATLLGTTGQSLLNGVATYSVSLTNGNGSGYSLTATDTTQPTVASAQSGDFALPFTAVPTSAAISFLTQPGSVETTGSTISATVQAAVYDQDGNLMPTQQIAYSIGGLPNLHCPDGTTGGSCVEDVVGGQATISATVQAGDEAGLSATGDGFSIVVQGWAAGKAVGSPVQSQPFEISTPSPLILASGSTTWGSSTGAWGQTVPSYSSPASTGSYTLPYIFAGVQFSFPYTAGDHVVIAGDTPSSQLCVQGNWQLVITSGPGGPAYQPFTGSGCGAPIDLATLSLPTGTYGGELLLTAPSGASSYGADDIVLYGPWGTYGSPVEWPMNSLPQTYLPIELQLAQSVALNVGGAATALPIDVTSSPMPVNGVHAEATWDPTALDVKIDAPSGGAIDFGSRVPGHWGFMAFTASGATAGDPVATLDASCLQAGIWPVTFSGNWWFDAANGSEVSQPFDYTANVACSAPAATATASLAGVSVNPADGSQRIVLTSTGLGSAAQAKLLDASGQTVASATSVSADASGATVTFLGAPGGIYTLAVQDATGTTLASEANVDVPPALPYFALREVDSLAQVPGFGVTHIWQLTNAGDVDGTAVLLFVFPSFLSSEPTLDVGALPTGSSLLQHDQSLSGATGSWAEIVSVPVAAGAAVDIPWTVTLAPSAVFGQTPVIQLTDSMPMTAEVLGTLTTAEAQSLGLLSGPYTGQGYGTQLAQDSNAILYDALGNLTTLGSPDAGTYETYLQGAYPSLASELYGHNLLGQVEMLVQQVGSGLVTVPQH